MIQNKRYRDGKEVPKKRPPSPTKAQYAKAYARQLYDALQIRVTELRQLDQEGLVHKNLTKTIQTFLNDVLEVHDATAQLGSRITTSLMIEVNRLHTAVNDFDAYIDKHLECHTAKQLLLGMSLADLCEDVRHFVLQITITHTSITADRPHKMLPNRPTDWGKREIFLQEVSAYRAIHGANTYPPHNILAKRMANSGYSLPERTFRDWRKQHQDGKFNNLVQDRR